MSETPSRPLLFTNLAQVAACTGPAAYTGGDPAALLDRTAVAVRDAHIAGVGTPAEMAALVPRAQSVDCRGGVLSPGLVDSHTHSVFGRWRADDYALRVRGVPYMEIARRGGGINASVRDLRQRSEEDLVRLALPRLRQMLATGTTVAEVKSGYGLSVEDELKMLRVIRQLDGLQPVGLIPTFLGAHEVPPEFRGRADEYVDLVVNEMIPAVADGRLARFCDVFMEPGVFTRTQSERILRAGLAAGLRPKLHADELEESGGAALAAELGAASADHLGAISDDGIGKLAASSTVATLLPATLFFLGRDQYAPARRLLEAGATVALASDFNPGTAPTPNLTLAMSVACSQMGMTPAESLRAATAGGAAALEIGGGLGTIAPGAPADLVLWDVGDAAEIPYLMGGARCAGVWKAGRQVLPELPDD